MGKDNIKKSYLILSASYGSGHVRAAEALVEHLSTEGHTATHTDLLSFVSPMVANILRAPYIILMQRFPTLYGWIYTLLQYPTGLRLLQASYNPIIWSKKKAILSCIEQAKADIIICTHFTWGEILDALIDEGVSVPRYYMVVTDYTYHPMWRHKYGAGYLVGSTDVRDMFIAGGISPKLLHVSGIPVSPLFQTTHIPTKDRITILLGGYGLVSPVTKISNIITSYPDTPIHIICGKNNTLVKKLQKKYRATDTVHVHGWIDSVHTYICSSFFVVTKTGGITTTECLVAGTPIDAIAPIPGQETSNYLFLKQHNLLHPHTRQKNTEAIPVFDISHVPFLF